MSTVSVIEKSGKMVKTQIVSFISRFYTLWSKYSEQWWIVKKMPLRLAFQGDYKQSFCQATPQSSSSSQEEQWMLTMDRVAGFGLNAILKNPTTTWSVSFRVNTPCNLGNLTLTHFCDITAGEEMRRVIHLTRFWGAGVYSTYIQAEPSPPLAS